MNEVWKKLISAFLALVMVFQMVPVTSLAAEHQDEPDDTVNWDMPEPEEPDVVGEVEELRDHTSKQFRLSDGSFAAVNYGIPVHYLDEDNNWVDVDNTLTYSATAGQYMSVNGDEQRGFADTLANGQPVLVSQYENYSVELTLLPMTYETVRDEVVVMDQEDMAGAAASEPVSEATEAPETEPPIEETEYTEPVETTVLAETNSEITEPTEATEATEPSEPELSGGAETTSETLGTDAEAEESEATEVPTEPVEETEGTEAPIETEVMEPVPETTVSEETVPETTLPEETVPETTIPEESEPQITEPVETVPETTVPAETIPETTIPEETVIPETTEPDDLEETVTETVMPSSVSAIVLNPGEASMYSSREDMPLSEQVLPEKMGSHVIYEDVFPGIDLMYENYGYNIKETILVNELQESYAYSFLLTAEGLTATLTDSGSITLTDVDGEVIYEIPAPYMFDAAGETSYAVEHSLEEVDGDYILTVTADAEWIEDEERVLPVSIDPTITVKCEYVSGGTLYTSHVVQGDPNLAHNGDDEQYIGYGMGYNSTGSVPIRECQIFLHVADLPDIPEGCTMVEATLQMYNYGETGYSHIGNCTDLEIAAYPVTSSGPSNGDYRTWIEGLTWNTKPTFDRDKLIDFAIASYDTMGGYIQWDLTEQVNDWYENDTVNRTLALAGYEYNKYSSTYCAVAVLKGYGSSNPPTLIVKYRSAIGVESYYSAQTQGIGAAGTGYVGDYSGQLVLVKNLASHASNVMPFSLNLVYNSYYAATRFKEVRNTAMQFGNGWKLDAVQTLSKCTGDLSNYMLYIDGDGTYHYFKSNSAGTQWDDEDGLDMTIKKASITSTSGSTLKTDGYAISNGQGDKLLFYNGYLVQQADANGNKIYYLYNGATTATSTSWLPTTGTTNKLTMVIQRNDGATVDIPLATLTYDSSTKRLATVKDRADYVYTLVYDDSGNLISVTSTNGHTATYNYTSGYMNEAIDSTGQYKIDYDYTTDPYDSSRKRISGFTEYGRSSASSSWKAGAKVVVTSTRDKATYQSSGFDGAITNLETASASTIANSDDILTTYLFDDEGRTINSNTTNANQSVVYGASTGAYATSSGTSNTNNHLMNSANIGTAAINLITNGGFETESASTSGLANGWTYQKDAESGMAITMKNDGHRTGNYALKTWFDSSTTGKVWAYQAVSGLTSGATYTFSAYVNTTGITSFGSGGGVYLSAASGSTVSSDTVNYVTASAMDSGWTRISVTFTANSAGTATLYIYVKNAVGTAYVDDCQLEKDDAPGNVNLLANGSLESSTGWNVKTPDTTSVKSGGLGGTKAMGMDIDPTSNGYIVQTVPVNLPYTETYVLSGWAKATALPNNQPQLPKTKLFTLKAELYYTDGTCDEFFLPFSAEIDNEWQFASMVLVPTKKQTVTKILVLCCYFQNTGLALFDNISLVREPAQTMKYDSNGYLVSVATDGISEDVNTYSGGNLIQTVTSGSGTFNYTYDSAHNLTKATNSVVTQTNTYNTRGNATTTVLSGSGTSETITTSATYLDSGNNLHEYTDMLGSKYSTAYTNSINMMYGLPSSSWDQENVQTVYAYHSDGKTSFQFLRTKGDTDEFVRLTYGYDGMDRLTGITRASGTGVKTTNPKTQIYTLGYDAFDQVTTVKVGTRILTTNDYDDAGLLEKQTFGNGGSVSYEYDELGRVKTTTTETGKKVEYAYNSDGQLASKTMNPSTTKLRYDYLYDSLGRLIRSSRHDNGTLKLETRHEYDNSNRLSKQYINLVDRVESVAYTYNDKGLLTKLDNNNASDVTYAYDKLQRLSTRTNPTIVQTYGYKQGTNLVNSISYDPGTSGTLFTALDLTYEYDYLGNIVSITSTGTNIVENADFDYDKQGQLTNATIGSTDYEYTYDTAGNILTVKKNNVVTGSYEYAASGWIDLLMSYNEVDFEYDAIGNPKKYYNGTDWEFTWQNGRELTTASKTGTSISYTYDGDGIRTSKTVGDVTYNYVYASGKLMRQTWTENGTTKVMDFVYDDKGAPYAFRYNNRYYYYVLNLQGDVVKIVAASGDSYGVYRYDAWGNITYSTNNDVMNSNPLRYRGYVYDTETGFYYLQSRYYDPAIGRFINADSFASTGQDFIGYNMFAYCGNNPVNRSDFTGAAWEHWAFAAGIVAIAAAAVVIASGGVAAAAFAVASIANGVAVSSTVATVAAGAFVGSAYGLAASAYGAWIESDSAAEFADYGKNGLLSTAAGGAFGGVSAYGLSGHTCFAAGTMVKAENGNIPIEQVAAGMLVWAWNEETGDVGLKRVVETYESETRDLVHVFVNGEEIITTPTHPFYSPVKGWMQAVHLRAGDILVLVNGEYVVVEKVQYEILHSPVKVYNFQVEDYHTYYVAEHGVLVHNRCILDKNGVRVEVRTSNEHGLPHAHISDGKVNTTIGLDQAPMRGHPSLTSKMWQVVEKNWEAIADGINQYFPKTH